MPIFGADQIALQEIFGKEKLEAVTNTKKEMKLRKLAIERDNIL